MAKRLTSTEKWDDPWFRRLKPEFKSLWFFLCEKCDHAGIWKVDKESMVFYIGRSYEQQEAFDVLNDGKDRVVSLNCGSKWFVKEFVAFQYGELQESNRVHQSVISILKKEGAYKTLARVLQETTDKEKDKDTDTDTVKGINNKDNINTVSVAAPWLEKGEYKTLDMLYGLKDLIQHLISRGFDSVKADELAKEIKGVSVA